MQDSTIAGVGDPKIAVGVHPRPLRGTKGLRPNSIYVAGRRSIVAAIRFEAGLADDQIGRLPINKR